MTVMNAVSRTNQTERPSTPSVYQTLKRAIQACFSTNCIAAVPRLKPVTSGIVTRKLAIAATSAAQRTASARSSRPKASSSTPASDGQPDGDAQKRHVLVVRRVGRQRPRIMLPRNGQSCQVMRPITPTIMTSAYQ